MAETNARNSIVRNLALAPDGALKIDWVSQHMPVLNRIKQRFQQEQPFAGLRVAICLHLEAKTAYLAQVIAAGGADVAIAGSNPLSTQDDVAAGLAASGVRVFAWYGATEQEYLDFLDKLCDHQPDLLIDDGGDLVHRLHTERRDVLGHVRGGAEETTTGVLRLRAMAAEGALQFPMVAVNDAYCKYLFDNRYGTGQSTWDGIMRTTNLAVAGKTVVVAGYGWCGKGVALRAKGLGARVIVCEVDPIMANEAWMDGCEVMPMAEAARHGDIFVTVTGCKDVIRGEHFRVMKDGAVMCNSGHFDVEINKVDLAALAQSRRTVRRNIEEYAMADGRKLYLLAEGRLVNLAAGDGHPAEIMDLTFALQALSLEFLGKQTAGGKRLAAEVIPVSREIDQEVARLRLEALGLAIDRLSPEQDQYLKSWQGQ